MHRIHLNIGSNQGDRRAVIGRAVALLAGALGGRLELSSYIESEPWGYDSPNPFLNLGVLALVPVEITPVQVLEITRGIERQIGPESAHRNPDGSYRDRVIDIDIIDFDGISIVTPELVLPHPRAAQRDFVMIPMAELDPRAAARLAQETGKREEQ